MTHMIPDQVDLTAPTWSDWPYAVRRYNGSGVNSFWYQAEVLLKVKGEGGVAEHRQHSDE